VLAKPGSITPHKNFRGQILHIEEGRGRTAHAVFQGYRPQFYFRTTDVTGEVKLPEGTEMVMPGDNVNMEINLITRSRGGEAAFRYSGRRQDVGSVS